MLKTTLLGLFGVLLFASLVRLLWNDERKGAHGALSPVIALVVLILLLRPLVTLLRGDFDLHLGGIQDSEDRYQQIFENTLTVQGEQDLRKGIHLLLETRYNVGVKDAEIYILYTSDGSLDGIRIVLQGKGLLQDPRVIQNDFENRLKCKVEVR